MAVKSAVYDYSLYTPDYYLKGFLAGGVCCSVTLCRNQNSLRARRDALLHFHGVGRPKFDFHAGGSGSMYSRMATIAGEMGFYKLATQGLGARCIMIGGLTAGQFAIFDSMLPAIGIDKFHYHEPAAEH